MPMRLDCLGENRIPNPSAPALEECSRATMLERPGGKTETIDFGAVKWSWSCRDLSDACSQPTHQLRIEKTKPRPADVVLVRVKNVGHHSYLETDTERRLRLYQGDHLMCVFGNRYATDVYEGLVLGAKKLHLLTGSGIIGTVVSQNRDVGRPTSLTLLGYLADTNGCRVNLKELRFGPAPAAGELPAVILVVGSGMSTGKTTVTRKVLQGLASRGIVVAGCKLTGSASPRDLYEMRATKAVHATDFSDYGFPSTYGAAPGELLGLLERMLAACASKGSQVAVVEIADGFLQRETQMLIECEELRRRVAGVVVAGACSSSALYGVEFLQRAGLDVWAVSGLMTNSPLFIREFTTRCAVPVGSSRTGGQRLVKILLKQMLLKKIFSRQEKSAQAD